MTDSNSIFTFLPGEVVETSYGVGVVTKSPNERTGNAYQVYLWRVPGKSIASSTVAYLQASTNWKRLPAAPGMITCLRQQNGGDPADANQQIKQRYMVQAYYPQREIYRILPLSHPDNLSSNPSGNNNDKKRESIRRLSRLSIISPTSQLLSSTSTSGGDIVETDPASPVSPDMMALEVTPDQLEPAPSASFYPLLCELMKRADEASHATREFLHTQQVTTVVQQANQYTKEKGEQAKNALDKASAQLETGSVDMTTADAVTKKLKNVAQTEQVQQLVEMLKTEDLTILLQRGKERLEQLMQDDIPQASKAALEKAGIQIEDDEDTAPPDGTKRGHSYKVAIIESRKAALKAMQKVLEDQAKINPNDLQAIQQSLTENFGTMLDSWQEAAKTDRNLAAIFETVNAQTAAWQEATGRLMNTRSASIFLDGASRIHARARTLFSKDQLQWAGEIGAKFTKAFTEGDAAVARLKSIELGDKVRDRLVFAIEMRSESLGGLDGIIAGALTAINKVGGNVNDQVGGAQMKNMLTNLQSRASSFTKDANETLISVLANQSEYQDVALLRVEQVLCDLKSQFGQDLSPDDIASLAQGEGGTAKLFEPIARRAAKEIEKQLDVAESSISDPGMLDVLKHVRKIMSGELTMGAVLDEIVNILNDDKVVAAGENLVKHGEQVLDAIEGVNANRVVDDVMNIAGRAGITKDTVMEGIESLNVNELLDNAGNAITDEKARQKLLSDATDTALDFILRILPSMPVPPVEGVKDGLVYQLSNLSMEGFKVRKENILVEIAGMRATKRGRRQPKTDNMEDTAWSSPAGFARSQSDSQGTIASTGSFDSQGMDFDTSVDENVIVKATELLIIDVNEISAVMNGVAWSFEQTYMPYLKGSGKFDVKMSDGAIRLVFELRKRSKETSDENGNKQLKWEPVLCLHDRSCSISSVDFNMQGGSRLAWVINKVAVAFKSLLRDYVVRTIMRILTDKSGWILSKLNQGLSPFWDVLLRTAKLSMEELDIATQKDIMEATPMPKTTLIELVWRERLPLGVNLLLNDESGQLKVVDFPRGSQARTVCEKRNLDPEIFKGSTVVAVNGIKYQTDDELFEALRDPGRPKTIQFELAESEDAERVRKFVEESQALGNSRNRTPSAPKRTMKDRVFATRRVIFTDPMDLGIEFANSPDNAGLLVRKFLETDDGLVLAAARKQDQIHVGDLLTHINGQTVLGEGGSGRMKALKLLELECAKRPLKMTFTDPYLHLVLYEKSPKLPYVIGGPEEVILKEDKESKRILLDGFKEVEGCCEKAGVMLGDYLVFLNGMTVGAACRWMGESISPPLRRIQEMMQDPANYPIGLTFARPARQQDGDNRGWTSSLLGIGPEMSISLETSETTCVTAEYYDQLGLELEQKEYNDIVVKDLFAIDGPFQVATRKLLDPNTESFSHLSVDSINGEFVPSFATTQMVKSAIERSWKANDNVGVVYCDYDRKKFVSNLMDEQG